MFKKVLLITIFILSVNIAYGCEVGEKEVISESFDCSGGFKNGVCIGTKTNIKKNIECIKIDTTKSTDLGITLSKEQKERNSNEAFQKFKNAEILKSYKKIQEDVKSGKIDSFEEMDRLDSIGLGNANITEDKNGNVIISAPGIYVNERTTSSTSTDGGSSKFDKLEQQQKETTVKPGYSTQEAQSLDSSLTTIETLSKKSNPTAEDQKVLDAAYKKLEDAGIDTGDGWFSDRSLEQTRANVQSKINSVEAKDKKDWEAASAEFDNMDVAEANDVVTGIDDTIKAKQLERSKIEESALKKKEEYNNLSNKLKEAQDKGDLTEVKKLQGELTKAKDSYNSEVQKRNSILKKEQELKSKKTKALDQVDLAKKEKAVTSACGDNDENSNSSACKSAQYAYEKKDKEISINNDIEQGQKDLEKAKRKIQSQAQLMQATCKGTDAESKRLCGVYTENYKDAVNEKKSAETVVDQKKAEQSVNKNIDKVNVACTAGDTVECRQAISAMNEAETDKARADRDRAALEKKDACYDTSSTACKEATAKLAKAEADVKKADELSDDTNKYTDTVKKEAEAQKNIDSAKEKVNDLCTKGDTPECRAAIADMNKAEANKACVSDPSSKACTDAKSIASDSKNLVGDYEKELKKKEDEAKAKVAKACKADKESSECKAAEAELAAASENVACGTDSSSEACNVASKEASDASKVADETKKAEEAEAAANPGLARIKKGDQSLMKGLLGYTEENSIIKLDSKDKGGFTILSGITVWFKNSLSSLIMLISVGAFLYVGIRLGMARGNPEEFKKGLSQMIYIIVGIFIVSIAWSIVYLIAGLNI